MVVFLSGNVLYHGHTLTIVWDYDGSRYHVGRGLRIYIDGHLRAYRPDIGKLIIPDAL